MTRGSFALKNEGGKVFNMNRYWWLLLLMTFASGKESMNAEDKVKMPIIIAHRGASVKAPENTLASITAALKAGADWVEWDTRVTSDGHLLLQHDETLERFTGKKVAVDAMTLEESQQYDVGFWFDEKFTDEKMPTLRDAIENSLPQMMPLIERKQGSAALHLEVLKDMGVVRKVAVQAFDWDFLRDLRKLAPELKIGALGKKRVNEGKVQEIVDMKADFVGWSAKDLKRTDIEFFHANGIKVAVWTVDDPEEIHKFVSWGIDMIITNDPSRTRKIVEEGR